jgi:hypothetical protein
LLPYPAFVVLLSLLSASPDLLQRLPGSQPDLLGRLPTSIDYLAEEAIQRSALRLLFTTTPFIISSDGAGRGIETLCDG